MPARTQVPEQLYWKPPPPNCQMPPDALPAHSSGHCYCAVCCLPGMGSHCGLHSPAWFLPALCWFRGCSPGPDSPGAQHCGYLPRPSLCPAGAPYQAPCPCGRWNLSAGGILLALLFRFCLFILLCRFLLFPRFGGFLLLFLLLLFLYSLVFCQHGFHQFSLFPARSAL